MVGDPTLESATRQRTSKKELANLGPVGSKGAGVPTPLTLKGVVAMGSESNSESNGRSRGERREDGHYRTFEVLRTVLTIINFAANVVRWVHEILG